MLLGDLACRGAIGITLWEEKLVIEEKQWSLLRRLAFMPTWDDRSSDSREWLTGFTQARHAHQTLNTAGGPPSGVSSCVLPAR